MTFDEVNKIEVIQSMREQKGFWQTVLDELKKLFLWLLRRFISWLKAVIKWLETIIRDIAEEARLYIVFVVIFLFGVGIYMIQEIFPLAEEKRAYLSATGLSVSIGSIIVILIQVVKTILRKLGLLSPVINLKEKIITKINLNDKPTRKAEIPKTDVIKELNITDGASSNQNTPTTENLSA